VIHIEIYIDSEPTGVLDLDEEGLGSKDEGFDFCHDCYSKFSEYLDGMVEYEIK
jgi:hypothetical protein